MPEESAWVDFVAGWCSGGAAVLLCQPIDTVLTRLQAHHGSTFGGELKSLVPQNGFTSLWRGSSCMISAVPLQNALLMSGYGVGTRLVSDDNILWGAFLGGCTGGVVQSFLMSPVELVKVKQQVIGVDLVKTSGEVTRGLLSNVGWKGLGATLLRDGIPHGVWFASYQWCKDLMDAKIGGSSHHDNATIPITSGAFAATTAWVSFNETDYGCGLSLLSFTYTTMLSSYFVCVF